MIRLISSPLVRDFDSAPGVVVATIIVSFWTPSRAREEALVASVAAAEEVDPPTPF